MFHMWCKLTLWKSLNFLTFRHQNDSVRFRSMVALKQECSLRTYVSAPCFSYVTWLPPLPSSPFRGCHRREHWLFETPKNDQSVVFFCDIDRYTVNTPNNLKMESYLSTNRPWFWALNKTDSTEFVPGCWMSHLTPDVSLNTVTLYLQRLEKVWKPHGNWSAAT